MIRLIIDGVECPIVGSISLPQFSMSKLASCEAWREGYNIAAEVASTSETDTLFGHFRELHHSKDFNDSYHTATLEVDGVAFVTGMATLLGYYHRKRQPRYKLRIRTGGAEWAERAALTRLNKVALDDSMTMSLNDITASWSNDSAIRFIPLWRDSYPTEADSSISAPQRSLMPHNYHPFLSIRRILEEVIHESGYNLKSDFFTSPLFDSLMMSGAYHKVDTEQAERAMGFLAYRTFSSKATADTGGRVCIHGSQSDNNCGAIVDTASPTATDENGEVFYNAFNNNGVLSFENEDPIFTPTREINVAFDIRLKYITDYTIASSKYLQGFDTITVGYGCEIPLKLKNPFPDRRNNVTPYKSYMLMIFDDMEGYEFTLGAPAVATITQRDTIIVMPADVSSSLQLYYRAKGTLTYYTYEGDWALYDGHVTRNGRCHVDIELRTPFNRYTPTSPKAINDIFISGAAEGQTLTLCSGCSVRPVFSGAAGYGEVVTYADVANHDISVMDLFNAMKQMFNLRFYTHEPSKSLYIEPYDAMDDGKIVDWRERQCNGEQQLISRVVDCFEDTRIGYLPADGVTKRLTGDDTTFGLWKHHIDSYAAKQGIKSIYNPLFMPTISLTGFSGSAPSAKILTVGNRDIITSNHSVEPRVVMYHGIVALPTDQRWESPTEDKGYPLATFHDPESGMSLCFENRDNCTGLNNYYINYLQEMAQRELFVCDIHLNAKEFISLFDLDDGDVTILSRFRLDLNGNSSLFKLHEIDSYDPSTGIARCSFHRTMNDLPKNFLQKTTSNDDKP